MSSSLLPARAALCLLLAGVSAVAIDRAEAAPRAAEKTQAVSSVSIAGLLATGERQALPADGVAVVELREVGRAGAPVQLKAIAASSRALVDGQLPIPFTLDVPRADLARGRSYLVRAAILTSGRPAWLAASRPLQITSDTVELGTLLLSAAKQPPPRTLSCGDRRATMRAGEVAELSVGSKRWLLSPVTAGSARYAAADAPLTTLWVTDDRATLVVKGQPWQECDVEPFRARGSEPRWHIEIGKDLRFESGGHLLEAKTPPLSGSAGIARYVTESQGEPITVSIFERRCADSMSGMPYPHAVEVTAFGHTYQGCGGEPLALLQGTEWVVTDVTGVSPGGSPVTLNFGADGRAYGQGPCNPYSAGYTLTGERLGFSLGVAAQSCEPGVMQREKTYFQLLRRTQRFEIASDGALLLKTGSGRTIKARPSELP